MKRLMMIAVMGLVASGVLAKDIPKVSMGSGSVGGGGGLMVPVNLEPLQSVSAVEEKEDLGEHLSLLSIPKGSVTVSGVPFQLTGKAIDVGQSMRGVKEPFGVVDGYLNEKSTSKHSRLVAKVPPDQYTALHVLAFSRKNGEAVPRFTARLGLFGGSAAGILSDVRVSVPDVVSGGNETYVVGRVPVHISGDKEGYLYHLRIPLDRSGDIWEVAKSRGIMDKKGNSGFSLEFTRDVNVHIAPPDPSEYTLLPAGAPSGVIIVGATLEKSPISAGYSTAEPGNVFYENQKVVFNVSLTNCTDHSLKGTIKMVYAGPGTEEEYNLGRQSWTKEESFSVAQGGGVLVPVDVTPSPAKRGWYSCLFSVEVDGKPVQSRQTSFALLAPDTRKALTDSPFGVWEFFGTHATMNSSGNLVREVLQLMNKGGWRWTYGGSVSQAKGKKASVVEDSDNIQKEMIDKYKIRYNMIGLPGSKPTGTSKFDATEFQDKTLPAMKANQEKGGDNVYKVLHESRISMGLICRYNEFLGGKPYDMTEEDKKKLDNQFSAVTNFCASVKREDPTAKILLINDYPPMAIEYMKKGMPHEYFDIFGFEGPNFMREPERSADWLGLLSFGETMRLAKEKYGYTDKPQWTTEALYHGTVPGNLSLHKQAVIYVREAMLAFANGYSRLAAAGILKDPSDDYHWSNWGGAGFCFREPELNPKPSYSMMAWLTQVLDQARYAGHLETPNTSLQALTFKKADKSEIYSVWVVRGAQTVTLKVADGKPEVYDCYGNKQSVEASGNSLTVSVGDAPLYVVGAKLSGITKADPIELPADGGTKVVDFKNDDQVSVVKTPSKMLESNWDFLRMKGSFKTSMDNVDGTTALRIELLPDSDPRKLLQRYVEFKLADPVVLPGRPAEITARVKGNGAWGCLMFEATDAKGRIWTSNGALMSGNGGNPKGDDYFSFAGWQTMSTTLVGQYPGSDQFVTWPRNFEWSVTNAPEYGTELKTYEDKIASFDKARAEEATNGPAFTVPKTGKNGKTLTRDQRVNAAKMAKSKAKKEGKVIVPKKNPEFRFTGIAHVDYPLTLTKVIVAMPPQILYVDGRKDVANPVVWIDWIGVKPAKDGM